MMPSDLFCSIFVASHEDSVEVKSRGSHSAAGLDVMGHLLTRWSEQAQLGKSAWSSAVSRAKGEKILDDPKLLRR